MSITQEGILVVIIRIRVIIMTGRGSVVYKRGKKGNNI